MPSEECFGEGFETVSERTVPRDGVHGEMHTAFCPHCLGGHIASAQHPSLSLPHTTLKSPETEHKRYKNLFHKHHATIR